MQAPLALFLALAALAGCMTATAPSRVVDAPAAPHDGATRAVGSAHAPPAAPPPYDLQHFGKFSWATGADAAGRALLIGPSQTGFPFEVPPETVGIDASAQWTCATPVCAVRLVLEDAEAAANTSSAAGRASLHVADPHAGPWRVAGLPAGPSASAQGSIVVVVHVVPEAPRAGQVTPLNRTPAPQRVTKAIGWTAAAGLPDNPLGIAMVASNNSLNITVPDHATALEVTANWTCATPACTLDFYAGLEGGSSGSPAASGQASVAFRIAAPKIGTWVIQAAPAGASVGLQGTVTATVVA
ncbi:MAG: hypothetical protein ACYDBQ_08335 [Thermoplasmatota archaeon]